LEPFLGAVTELSAATASTLLRFSARACGELDDVARGRALAEEALLRAEETGDPALIGWALNDVAALHYFAGQRRLGVVVLDGAIEYCQAHHASEPLMAVLMNRAVGPTASDAREALRVYEQALESSRQASDSWGVLITALALHMVHTIVGRWDDDAAVTEETAWLIDPLMDDLPLFRLVFEALEVLRSWARGEMSIRQLGPADDELLEHSRADMGQETALVRLVSARTGPGLADLAVELGKAAVAGKNQAGGTSEWYPFLWSRAVDRLIESGTPEDLAAARRGIAVVDGRPRLQPATLAQLPRLRATVAIRGDGSGADLTAVETDLTEAIALLDAYGAVPDRVRAQEELGRWLCRSGREDEGSALLTESAKFRAELGMPLLPV
jgi:hypothetical protein